jgi:hypothetical protein
LARLEVLGIRRGDLPSGWDSTSITLPSLIWDYSLYISDGDNRPPIPFPPSLRVWAVDLHRTGRHLTDWQAQNDTAMSKHLKTLTATYTALNSPLTEPHLLILPSQLRLPAPHLPKVKAEILNLLQACETKGVQVIWEKQIDVLRVEGSAVSPVFWAYMRRRKAEQQQQQQ